jgi:heme exporter protein A
MRLVVDSLSGGRGDHLLFTSVCCTLERGETLVITGPNGAGKSTLLRIIAGFLPAADGGTWLETDEGKLPVSVHSHYLSTLNAMKPALSVYENLKFWQDFHGSKLHEIDEALEIVGLFNIDHLPYGVLSTGQKRRVSIAMLLCSRRSVWLLDEPTSGLDHDAQAMFANVMRDHLRTGGLIIAVTHIDLGLDAADSQRITYLALQDYLPQDHDAEMQDTGSRGWGV